MESPSALPNPPRNPPPAPRPPRKFQDILPLPELRQMIYLLVASPKRHIYAAPIASSSNTKPQNTPISKHHAISAKPRGISSSRNTLLRLDSLSRTGNILVNEMGSTPMNPLNDFSSKSLELEAAKEIEMAHALEIYMNTHSLERGKFRQITRLEKLYPPLNHPLWFDAKEDTFIVRCNGMF